MEKRVDLYTALLIDAVLKTAAQQGTRVSVHALERLGLSHEVAVRVSTRPRERRVQVRLSSVQSSIMALAT
jgi:hypothetical protein